MVSPLPCVNSHLPTVLSPLYSEKVFRSSDQIFFPSLPCPLFSSPLILYPLSPDLCPSRANKPPLCWNLGLRASCANFKVLSIGISPINEMKGGLGRHHNKLSAKERQLCFIQILSPLWGIHYLLKLLMCMSLWNTHLKHTSKLKAKSIYQVQVGIKSPEKKLRT